MKCVIEFGVRGGRLSETNVLATVRAGAKLATALVHVFGGEAQTIKGWTVKRGMPRVSWQSSTHFVSLSVLDGADRGPASAQLWKP